MTEEQKLALRQEKKEEYAKKKAALRYRMHGMTNLDKGWFDALRALDFGEKHHKGYRKDKITPAYMHQIEIALYILTLLPHLIYPVRTMIAVLLHDTPEDTHVSHEEIRDLFGVDAMIDVELLTKEYRGTKKDPESYFGGMAESPVASIGKGGDRIHNQYSMAGVFTLERQIAYTVETRTHFFKFLKEARRRFPQQELAYENIKFVLTAQVRVFEGANAQGIAA
jgi:(p)ppGpp synthase/HD superfamily hydrolase